MPGLFPSKSLYPSKGLYPSSSEGGGKESSNLSPGINLYPDPGFESGVLSYGFRELAAGVTDATRVVSNQVDEADPAYGPIIDGDCSLRVKAEANSGTGVILSVGWRVPTLVAQVWSAGVWAGFSSQGMKAQLSLGFQDDEFADLVTPIIYSGLVGLATPEFLKVENQVAPLTAAFVVVRLSLVATEGIPGSTTFDNVLLVEAPETPTHPIDGDRGGMDWVGARFMSPSYELGDAPTLADYRSWTPAYLWSPKVLSREL